jgi:hypothetical protein
LLQAGTSAPEEFDELIFATVFMNRCQTLQKYYQTLERYSEQPSWWATDLRAQINALECALDRCDVGALTDYPQLGQDGTYPGLQAVVRDFGHFVIAWPLMFDAARELKRKGISLRELSLRNH